MRFAWWKQNILIAMAMSVCASALVLVVSSVSDGLFDASHRASVDWSALVGAIYFSPIAGFLSLVHSAGSWFVTDTVGLPHRRLVAVASGPAIVAVVALALAGPQARTSESSNPLGAIAPAIGALFLIVGPAVYGALARLPAGPHSTTGNS